jgi:carbon-monoxide dehydrogenase large subunit
VDDFGIDSKVPPAGRLPGVTGTSILGNPVRRVEDPRILLGGARYVADLELPGGLTAVFVRSTMAHARLESVDTETAAKMPGVVGVYTADTLGLPDLPAFAMAPAAMCRPPLARGTVRFVGEPIAVVVAETDAQATDAAGEIIVDYDPLPAVADPEAALADGAPVLFPDHGSNLALEFDFGRIPDVLDGADTIVSGRIRNPRLAPVSLEANAAAAVPEGDDHLTLWVSSQHPFGLRDPLAGNLGLRPEHVRVACPAVGGGFGAKIPMYAEYAVIAGAARRLGRPVRWVETRSESMMALVHGRAQIQDFEIGVKADGTIVGLRAHVIADAGAYPGIGVFLPSFTRMMSSGVYAIPKVDVWTSAAVTNTTTVGAYRGAGRPEAAALIERAVDMVAAELGFDPVEIRRKNLIPPFGSPHTTAVGTVYDVGDYAAALDEVVRLAGYDDLRQEQKARRERGDRLALGIGLSVYVEITGGPGPVPEFGAVEVHADGTATAQAGTSPHGQGHETAFAQIVSAVLGVPMERVRVLHSDTAAVPEGNGTYGSRSLQLGGSSIFVAAENVLQMAKDRAADLLEANPDDVVLFDDGRFGVAGTPARSVGWEELAGAGDGPLRAEARYSQDANTFPFGAHIAVVEVDTETGSVNLLRMVAVDDAGRILNPLLAEGQVHGGLAQGIAQALFEEFAYDDEGTPLTATLADYLMPSAAELPSYETAHTVTPTPLNPLGAKGIGESGTIGSTPAVQNAVVDAVAHLGVRHIDMPLTPERVWRAIQEAQGDGH